MRNVERTVSATSAFKRRQIERVTRVVSGALEPNERLLVASEVQTRPGLPKWFRWVERLVFVVHPLGFFLVWLTKNRLVGLTDSRLVITRRRERLLRRGTRTVVAFTRDSIRIESGTGGSRLNIVSTDGTRVRFVFPERWWPEGRAIARGLATVPEPKIDRSFWGLNPPARRA
jgi:hypothetical protein